MWQHTKQKTAMLSVLLASVGLLFAPNTVAWALPITITGVSITRDGDGHPNIGYVIGPPQNPIRQYAQGRVSVGVLTSPTPGAEVPGTSTFFETRYASSASTDCEGPGCYMFSPATGVSKYQVQFTIEDPSNLGYTLAIDTSRSGAVTTVNDGTGIGLAGIGPVTGRFQGIARLGLRLDAGPTVSGDSGGNMGFSQSNTFYHTTIGTQTFDLEFDWTHQLQSHWPGNGDEAAIRLGLSGITTVIKNNVEYSIGITADDYPGVGGRTAADDGHFMTATATVLTIPRNYVSQSDGLFQFSINDLGDDGIGIDQPVFVTAPVDVGYDYAVIGVDPPNFAAVLVPAGLLVDEEFELLFGGRSETLVAGDEFLFTDFFPDGVSTFTIQGIDIDPGDPAEFRSGVTFVHASTVEFTMTRVPEPSTFVLAALALLGLGFFAWRGNRKAD